MSEKVNQEPNPHESSALPPEVIKHQYEADGVEVNQRPRTIIKDESGRVFIGGERLRYGSDQMLMVRLLKGIVSVSDIVYIKDKDGKGGYYSYKLPLEHIGEVLNPDEQENEANIEDLVCHDIFGDSDHAINFYHGGGHNFRSESRSFAFFDFENFRNFWIYGPEGWGKRMLSRRVRLDPKSKNILLKKMDELEARFQGDFLEDILKSIEKYKGDIPEVISKAPDGDKVESFRKEVLSRIAEVRKNIT